ncbi:MAG TPA: BMP family ABC transporter substrate-binding protein [Peptococcaceae bacterium]|nr:BMP family ABC transporter substrate-binding protein [Peptococcaceae bacterium]
MKNLIIAFTVLFLLLGTAACGGGSKGGGPTSGQQQEKKEGSAADKPKVALLLPGNINDLGWNTIAYEGLKLVEKEYGLTTSYMERVAQSEMEEVFRNYANQGFKVIFAHGFQFGDAALKVAKDFPEVKFIVTSHTIAQPPNLCSLIVDNTEVGFLAGYVAGLATKTGVVGYLGGKDIPPIRDAMYGYIVGAKLANPNVKVLATMLDTFEDVAKAKEQALAFIQQGADVLLGNGNEAGLGVIQACQEKDVLAIGYSMDQSSAAPNHVLASSLQSYQMAFKHVMGLILDGKWEPIHYRASLNEGATGIIWNEKVLAKLPAEVKTKTDEIEERIKAGELDIEKMVVEEGLKK